MAAPASSTSIGYSSAGPIDWPDLPSPMHGGICEKCRGPLQRPKLITPVTAAEMLTTALHPVSRARVYDMIKRGIIPANCVFRLGRTISIIEAPFIRWVNSGGTAFSEDTPFRQRAG